MFRGCEIIFGQPIDCCQPLTKILMQTGLRLQHVKADSQKGWLEVTNHTFAAR